MMFQPLNAKITPPNYEFDLEKLAVFFPEKGLEEVQKIYGKGEILHSQKGEETLRFIITHPRYQIPVIVQAKEGKILDFFARPPSYFLHDVFFQSLVNRLGKQNQYLKVGEEAVYQWEKESLKYVYSAACTITCFPIFYTVYPTQKIKNYLPLIEKMKTSHPRP